MKRQLITTNEVLKPPDESVAEQLATGCATNPAAVIFLKPAPQRS